MSSGPSVAIIGGGIAGLVCANRLSQLGINNTTVFDTGKHAPGGRCSSRSVIIDGMVHVFDHSAQYFTVSDSRFAKIVSYLDRKRAIRTWDGKIGHLKDGKFTADTTLTQAFIGVNGMQDIPKCLAENVNLKQSMWAGNVQWEDTARKWKVDRNKCPQENIPPKVEREVTERMLEGLKRVTGLRELPIVKFTRVQLWGAAVPMNILKTKDECVFDSHYNVGICGDWLTSPCIQGAAVSGLALAEMIHKHATGVSKNSTSLTPDFIPADSKTIGAFPTDPSMIFNPK